MRRQRGFTLLEAIVALVLLAAALAGAWTWIAGDVRALGRVRDLALEEAAVQQALDELEQVDLATRPEGSLNWREFRVDWRAAPLEPTRAGRAGTPNASAWEFTLYQVSLDVFHRERLIAAPDVRMLRYARIARAGEAP